jgi:hypothetical protein
MRGNSHVRFLGGKRRGNPPDPADDREHGIMFGFFILNGDLQNAEFGYIDMAQILTIPVMNLDYHFEEQSVEAALYKRYPRFFKKPPSLKK